MADDTAFSLLKQRSIGTTRAVFQHAPSVDRTLDRSKTPRSLYIHIPFCTHKCHYCDFYSIVDTRDRQERFASRLVRELIAQSRFAPEPLETIFVGGGTPSLLRPDLWAQLLHALHEHFDMSVIAAGEGEFSVECNPETVTGELAGVLRDGGVNRASLGAQSFNADHLETLERRHDPDKVIAAIQTLQSAGITRCSLDLIYAIPGQTTEHLEFDLQTALSMPIEHLSAYGLTYEPGTAMTARLVRGEFTQAPDELEAEMYNHTLGTLRSHGFRRYEVSNHAQPGAQCQHNLAYWRQQDWLAVGPSASGHYQGHRWKNTPRLDDYLNTDDDGFAPICDHEPPDTRRELMDLLMTTIRLSEGVDAISAMRVADSLDASDQLMRAAIMCADQGWVCNANSERWVLSDEGFLFADRVAREFIGALLQD
jgi:oxygen-independent coproporphyrinogen-3 oxidase